MIRILQSISSIGGAVSGKDANVGERGKLAEKELNHNILEAAEDIDLNDDDADVTMVKSKSPSQNGSNGDQLPPNHHLSPLEQVYIHI